MFILYFYPIDPYISSSFYCVVTSWWHCDLIVQSMRMSCFFDNASVLLCIFILALSHVKLNILNRVNRYAMPQTLYCVHTVD